MSSDTETFYRLISELDQLLVPGIGEGFWSARSIFAQMDRAFLNGWSMCRLQEMLDEKELLVFRDRSALTINITRGYAVSLALIEQPAPALYLYPQHCMARNVGPVPLTVRRYTTDRPVQNDIYDPQVRLELRDKVILQPGQSIERNGYTEVLDWESPGETGYVLRLHSEGHGHYEWAFDRETLTPRGATVLDSFASQLTTAMQMLVALGVPVNRDFIELGLASPHFQVRWDTMKMIGELAPELTGETLHRLKDDPHPAIRRAVERTLQMNTPGHGASV